MIARISLVLILCVAAITGNAQEKMYVYKDGVIIFQEETVEIDSVLFQQADYGDPIIHDDVYLVGSFNDWDTDNAYQMTQVGDRKFEYTIFEASDILFKFLGESKNWDTKFGIVRYSEVGEGDYILTSEDEWDISLPDGSWHVLVDLDKNIVSITKEQEIYIVGDATEADWDPATGIRLIKNTLSGTSTANVTFLSEDYTFRFLGQNTDWGPTTWFYDDCYSVESIPSGLVEAAPVNQYGEINFRMTEEGEYKVEASVHTSGKLMFVFTKL
ncbi:hypothetical protein [Saccharicrinis aurantiacus]|uniref:hypothetical protein n=1 Tax=Saccharicrinis aurantiacus TaxID=1849719 RepID=UPI0024921D04|nr:hypothetical protein [Saccharicrinis aurantiacus]